MIIENIYYERGVYEFVDNIIYSVWPYISKINRKQNSGSKGLNVV